MAANRLIVFMHLDGEKRKNCSLPARVSDLNDARSPNDIVPFHRESSGKYYPRLFHPCWSKFHKVETPQRKVFDIRSINHSGKNVSLRLFRSEITFKIVKSRSLLSHHPRNERCEIYNGIKVHYVVNLGGHSSGGSSTLKIHFPREKSPSLKIPLSAVFLLFPRSSDSVHCTFMFSER